MQTENQFSAGQALRGLTSSGRKLAVIAAASMLLTTVIPVLSVSGNVMGLGGGSIGASAVDLAGLLGWVVALLFVGAAAARFLQALKPYRNLLDMAALGLFAIAVVWACLGGPTVTDLKALSSQMKGFSGLMNGPSNGAFGGASPRSAVAISVLPSFGMLFLVLAPVALLMARRKPVTPAVASAA